MEVMSFRRGKKRKMISAVRDGSRDEGQDKKHDGRADVRAHEKWSGNGWHKVAEDVLDRVGVDGRDTDRSCPFVMHLVDMFI